MSQKNVTILQDGHLVSRVSDWIIYNVEAGNIDKVVAMYARCKNGVPSENYPV